MLLNVEYWSRLFLDDPYPAFAVCFTILSLPILKVYLCHLVLFSLNCIKTFILQVCVDLFLTTQNYVDIASLAVLPRSTGGQVYFCQIFTLDMFDFNIF